MILRNSSILSLAVCCSFIMLLIQKKWQGAAAFQQQQQQQRDFLVSSITTSSPPTSIHNHPVPVSFCNAKNNKRAVSTTSTTLWSNYNHVKIDETATTTTIKAKTLLSTLEELISTAPKNGIDTPKELAIQIQSICEQLEDITPNPSPTQHPELLNGFWFMLWTNYGPPAPSSGKLGPFIGDVYQDLQLPTTITNHNNNDSDDSTPTPASVSGGGGRGVARNIFKLDVPPIMGELYATPKVIDDTTIAITFVKVGTKFAQFIPLGPNVQFETGKEVRLWDHRYVDTQYRILYAKNAAADNDNNDAVTTSTNHQPSDTESGDSRGFLYVMKRADESRFATNI
jgi:hypothetical protein